MMKENEITIKKNEVIMKKNSEVQEAITTETTKNTNGNKDVVAVREENKILNDLFNCLRSFLGCYDTLMGSKINSVITIKTKEIIALQLIQSIIANNKELIKNNSAYILSAELIADNNNFNLYAFEKFTGISFIELSLMCYGFLEPDQNEILLINKFFNKKIFETQQENI